MTRNTIQLDPIVSRKSVVRVPALKHYDTAILVLIKQLDGPIKCRSFYHSCIFSNSLKNKGEGSKSKEFLEIKFLRKISEPALPPNKDPSV
jgi:hypothetical protein